MLYLLDANILITAQNFYYPLDRVPEFWGWLLHVGNQQRVKIPIELYEEITDGKDALAGWFKDDECRAALLLDEEVDVALVARVVEQGYAPDLTDDELEKTGRDPFLIAYALVASHQRCVVTGETSKPRRARANRHIPDVCQSMGVQCINAFQLFHILDFKTSWKSGI